MQIKKDAQIKYNYEKSIERLKELSNDGLYLYGAGIRGKMTYNYLSRIGVPIKGFIVSDYFEKKTEVENEKIETIHLSEYCKDMSHYILITSPAQEIVSNLIANDIAFYFLPEEFFSDIQAIDKN